jgi:aminoglycoside 2'-N-acetyltransferase I
VTDGVRLRKLPTSDLTSAELATIRSLMDVAFDTGDEEEQFTDEDWVHSLGGTHFVLDLDGILITHASVVEREIQIAGRVLRTGYVEAVATAPDRERAGFGSVVIEAVTSFIGGSFELGVLGTGRHHFYERFAWETWAGPAFVRTSDGPLRTPDDEGYLMVLRTPTSPRFELTEPISCEWRPGDVW